MPKKTFIIRHGETDHNKKGILQGWLDIPLNKTGIIQAKKLAKRLKGEKIHAIYSSDLKRAHDTAKVISDSLTLKIIKSKKLRERFMGDFQGLTWEQVKEKYKGSTENFFNSQLSRKKFNVETKLQMEKRITSIFDTIIRNHKNQTIAIVTHGGVKKSLLRLLKMKELNENWRIENTSVTEIIKDNKGKYHLKIIADASHLNKEL